MLFSRLHFSSELASCRHWWLAWGKWNALWHFVYKLFYWHLSVVETQIAQLRVAWDVNVCLFCVKTSIKEEGSITFTRSPRCRFNYCVFTAICLATLQSIKTAFIVWIFWKKWTIWNMRLCFLSKVTVKTRFEMFSTCSLPFHSSLYTYLYIVFSLHLNHCTSILDGFKDTD